MVRGRKKVTIYVRTYACLYVNPYLLVRTLVSLDYMQLLSHSPLLTFTPSSLPSPPLLSPPLPSLPTHRNYHIFYYMLAGASSSLRRRLSLKSVKEYCYLSQGVVPLGDVCEVDEFHRLKRSLAMLGLAEELQNRCVRACVHVNVKACVCVGWSCLHICIVQTKYVSIHPVPVPLPQPAILQPWPPPLHSPASFSTSSVTHVCTALFHTTA